jgi:hypothetical protein
MDTIRIKIRNLKHSFAKHMREMFSDNIGKEFDASPFREGSDMVEVFLKQNDEEEVSKTPFLLHRKDYKKVSVRK